jgi:2,3-bisphosphoglycerate-dependent phosphoglycerate mutase
VLLRHGESIWNAANRFASWVDVPLSELGWTEACRSGELLRDSGLLPEVVHTSLLRRAVSTADIALDVADRPDCRGVRIDPGGPVHVLSNQYAEAPSRLWRSSLVRAVPAPPAEDLAQQTDEVLRYLVGL